MISMIGLMPVMAPPTPRPTMPASEIGESIMRSGPNSSTRPESTLNGVPASATSSPIIKIVGSRRNSSASASRMAWPSVISRTLLLSFWLEAVLSIDMLLYLFRFRERRVECKLDSCLNFGTHFLLDVFKYPLVSQLLLNHPGREQFQRVTLTFPILLLFF